jgi:phosphate/sulfate permease
VTAVTEDEPAEQVPAPGQVRAAAAVIAAESLALFAAAVVLVVKTITGHPHSVAGALLGAGLALGAALVLATAARGLAKLRPASRTPVIVLQLLAVPVSYSLAFQAHRVGYGGPILLAAVVVLYLLFTPPARAALDRPPG